MGQNLLELLSEILSQHVSKKAYLNYGYLQSTVNRRVLKITGLSLSPEGYIVVGNLIGHVSTDGKFVHYDSPNALRLCLHEENAHWFSHHGEEPTGYRVPGLHYLSKEMKDGEYDHLAPCFEGKCQLGLINPMTMQVIECMAIPIAGYDHTRQDGVSVRQHYQLTFLYRTKQGHSYALPSITLEFSACLEYLRDYILVPDIRAGSEESLYSDLPEWCYDNN